MANIASTAMVHADAVLADGVVIDHGAIVEAGANIGANTRIGQYVKVHAGTSIGKNNTVHPFTCLGSDPQIRDLDHSFAGKLCIGDNNIIHEYVTISRGAHTGSGVTQIGSDNLLMANSHVGHDSLLMNHCILVNHATLAGHVQVQNHAIIGAFCAVHQFCTVGESAMMSAAAMVNKDILPYAIVARNPCKMYGVNRVGLQRRQIGAKAMANINMAYKTITSGKVILSQVLAKLEGMAEDCEYVRTMFDVLQQSERGIVR